jgi:hypothetical protein
MAAVDGIVPFADPFAFFGLYDPNDPVLRFSQTMGQIARDLLFIASAPTLATWIRNPFYYEVGCTTVPPRIWQVVENMSVFERGRYLWQMYGWSLYSLVLATYPSTGLRFGQAQLLGPGSYFCPSLRL